jgi:hypothetical protein
MSSAPLKTLACNKLELRLTCIKCCTNQATSMLRTKEKAFVGQKWTTLLLLVELCDQLISETVWISLNSLLSFLTMASQNITSASRLPSSNYMSDPVSLSPINANVTRCPDICKAIYENSNPDLAGVGVSIKH